MKVSVDDQEIYTLSETQKKVIMNDIHKDFFNSDMRRRLQYILMHKYEQCFKRLKAEWEPKLKERGIALFPSDDDAFAELIFAQPDYRDRKNRGD